MQGKIIWTLVTRLFHLLMIVLFVIGYISGDFDESLEFHAIFGFAFLLLVFWRIIWGFAGVKYSKFSDFNLNPKALGEYFLSIFSAHKACAGHNPASSWAVIFMLILSIVVGISGMLTYGIVENHGLFSFLHTYNSEEFKFIKELHEIAANLLIFLVVLHVCGAVLEHLKGGEGIRSMINGRKSCLCEEVKLNLAQKIISFLWIGSVVVTLFYLLLNPTNPLTASFNVRQDYAALNKNFAKECGSCHITYPPYLLKAAAWQNMMANLKDHFGDDASIDEPVVEAGILAFLKSNAAEHSTNKVAIKSLKENDDTIAFTQTKYWKKKHDKIDESVFQKNDIKSKANCAACHEGVEYGLLDKKLIKFRI